MVVSGPAQSERFRAELYSSDALEELARRMLPKEVYDFVAGGAGDERTVAANEAAFSRRFLRSRVLRGVSRPETSSVVVGSRLDYPLFISPMGGQKLVHRDGEIATARAAAVAGVANILSTASSVRLEDVASAAGEGVRWFQVYWQRDRAITRDLLARAEGAGFSAVFLTVDAPVQGFRRREAQNAFRRPAHVPFANLEPYGLADVGAQVAEGGRSPTAIDTGAPDELNWQAVEWLVGATPLPVLLKGVLRSDDAVRAMECGARGILVSNHGGRQMDGLPATIDVLEEIVDVVGDRGEVLFDGGVRRSADVFCALALGARAVGIGRPVLWALAADGEAGVTSLLEYWVRDLVRGLALLGASSPAALSRSDVLAAPW